MKNQNFELFKYRFNIFQHGAGPSSIPSAGSDVLTKINLINARSRARSRINAERQKGKKLIDKEKKDKVLLRPVIAKWMTKFKKSVTEKLAQAKTKNAFESLIKRAKEIITRMNSEVKSLLDKKQVLYNVTLASRKIIERQILDYYKNRIEDPEVKKRWIKEKNVLELEVIALTLSYTARWQENHDKAISNMNAAQINSLYSNIKNDSSFSPNSAVSKSLVGVYRRIIEIIGMWDFDSKKREQARKIYKKSTWERKLSEVGTEKVPNLPDWAGDKSKVNQDMKLIASSFSHVKAVVAKPISNADKLKLLNAAGPKILSKLQSLVPKGYLVGPPYRQKNSLKFNLQNKKLQIVGAIQVNFDAKGKLVYKFIDTNGHSFVLPRGFSTKANFKGLLEKGKDTLSKLPKITRVLVKVNNKTGMIGLEIQGDNLPTKDIPLNFNLGALPIGYSSYNNPSVGNLSTLGKILEGKYQSIIKNALTNIPGLSAHIRGQLLSKTNAQIDKLTASIFRKGAPLPTLIVEGVASADGDINHNLKKLGPGRAKSAIGKISTKIKEKFNVVTDSYIYGPGGVKIKTKSQLDDGWRIWLGQFKNLPGNGKATLAQLKAKIKQYNTTAKRTKLSNKEKKFIKENFIDVRGARLSIRPPKIKGKTARLVVKFPKKAQAQASNTSENIKIAMGEKRLTLG